MTGRRIEEYWLDGYNVIHGLGIAPEAPLEGRRDQLVRRCAVLKSRSWVVFDSRERPPSAELHARHGRVRVEFAANGKSADDTLVQRLDRTADARGIVLVTDDRQLGARAKARGATIMPVADFGPTLLPPPRARTKKRKLSERPLSRREVTEWMKYFGLDERGS